ncbi:MAG: hypothetical protein JXM70_04875 [Pirellulales bacterium]|nr:hypothetical protein [Pirellulales bacterium]
MQSPDQTENQRNSYRCPINETRQQTQIRFGKTWIPVELLDESAGGFGVHVEHAPQVGIGDIVWLRCGDKCFEVEVRHVTQFPHADGSQDETADGAACKLGLKRLSEVFLETGNHSPYLRRIMRKRSGLPYSPGGKGLAIGLMVAFLVGALPAVAVVLLGTNITDSWQADSRADENGFKFGSRSPSTKQTKIKLDGKVDGSHASASGDNGLRTTGSGISTTGKGVLPAKISLNKRQKGVWQMLLDNAKLQVDIEPWTDAVLVLLAKLVRQMGLSDLQQVESAQILEYTDQSLAKLNATGATENQEEFTQKQMSILEGAYASLINMLNDKQQDKWNELVEKQGEAAAEKK